TEGRSFYLFDALGSPVDLVNPDGSLRERNQYDAWGEVRSRVGSSWSPFGFTGHELDSESGFYYAKARFYDAEMGRFLSQDPVDGVANNPPSLNKYLYAFDDPTVYTDPSGEFGIGPNLYYFERALVLEAMLERQDAFVGSVEGLPNRSFRLFDEASHQRQ